MLGLTNFGVAYKPFSYAWAMDLAEQHEKIHWGTWEVELHEDLSDWKSGKLSPAEKAHITAILRLFTQSDVQVGANYCDQFIPVFRNNEIRNMLLSFANREGTHQRAYALLNDTLGLAEEEYSAFLNYEALRSKIEFMQDANVNTPAAIGSALARSVCFEGMGLFSAFVMLLNYQRFNKMKGMCKVVEWSIRDETLHAEGMAKLFRAFLDENPEIVTDKFKAGIYKNYEWAVAFEDAVIDLAYAEGGGQGLSAPEMKQYIRYLAGRRLVQLGLKDIFNVLENPLSWLDWVLCGDRHTNFFEQRVTDYNASGMSGDWNWDG